MSDFTSEGQKPFPNTHSDNAQISEVAEWPDDKLQNKLIEYWAFMDRTDLMERARTAGQRMLDLMGFEADYRFGVYDTEEVEHEQSRA